MGPAEAEDSPDRFWEEHNGYNKTTRCCEAQHKKGGRFRQAPPHHRTLTQFNADGAR